MDTKEVKAVNEVNNQHSGRFGLEQLGSVTPVEVGKDNDGLTRMIMGGSNAPADRPWGELASDARDALEAWRFNPMARRVIGVIVSQVVGDGINITSEDEKVAKAVAELWSHPSNRVLHEQGEWCAELARGGEIFMVIFPDPTGGPPVIRALTGSEIAEIEWARFGMYEDYRTELRYRQPPRNDYQLDADQDGTWWLHPCALEHPKANEWLKGESPTTVPLMMHFAVNRPVGAMRGEGDLTPVRHWLRRYQVWLEDRIRANAAARQFSWQVFVQEEEKQKWESKLMEKPPGSGTVLIMTDGQERLEAVSPNISANGAKDDGRALRWMIASGGPGMSLLDFGEGEDSNLATATAMSKQRHRFLRQRQDYFADMLAEVTILALKMGKLNGWSAGIEDVKKTDLVIDKPDVTADDNGELATAAGGILTAITTLGTLVGDSEGLREMSLRMFAKFSGENLTDLQVKGMLTEGKADLDRKKKMEEDESKAKSVIKPASPAPGGKK
jgi:hypothetical protein